MCKPFIVMDIGCMECWHATWYLGQFRTEAEAKAQHPDALTEDEMARKGWGGESAKVIFDLRKPHAEYPRNEEA